MSPKLKRLSGKQVVSSLEKFAFVVVSQRGSHIKLRRASGEIITVPAHRELDRGTLASIFRQACRFIPEDELRPHFYSD